MLIYLNCLFLFFPQISLFPNSKIFHLILLNLCSYSGPKSNSGQGPLYDIYIGYSSGITVICIPCIIYVFLYIYKYIFEKY
ncbi:hypothetical protein Hanom_Chr17g01567571 [Helianthus anomalus]